MLDVHAEVMHLLEGERLRTFVLQEPGDVVSVVLTSSCVKPELTSMVQAVVQRYATSLVAHHSDRHWKETSQEQQLTS